MRLLVFLFVVLTLVVKSQSLDDQESDGSSRIDLEEVNGKENACSLSSSSSNTRHLMMRCGKIPLFCRRVCDSVSGIYFDDIKLRKVSPFAFGSYKIKNNFQLVFASNHLRRIDSDSFNGLIIESDQTLKINIGYDLNDDDVDDDDEEDDLDYEQPEIVTNEENQIEYDSPIPSTKSGGDASSLEQPTDSVIPSSSSSSQSTSTLIIGPHSFRGIQIKSGGKLLLNIKNYSTVIFEENSLNSVKFMSSSSFGVSVDSASLVLFKSKCAKYWKANQLDDDDDNIKQDKLKRSVDINSVLFRLNVTNTESVLFEPDSFSDIELAKSSTFQILVKQFDKCVLGTSSFANIKQSERANFELSLSSGKSVQTSDELFAGLSQSVNSKMVFSVNGIQSDEHDNDHSTSICLKKHTFSNIKQAFNSTIRVTLSLLNSKSNVVLGADSLASILQSHKSLFQVYVLGGNKLIVASEAVSDLTQARESVFEIWSSRASSRVMFLSAALKRVKQADESIVRIGYVSSTSNKDSLYWQSHLMFDQFTSANHSQLVYDFSQSTRFELNFPPRPIPRIMPFGLVKNSDYDGDNEQTQAQRPQSIEEMAWRMYPELGRLSRPDIVNLRAMPKIESQDFCKVSQIPFDVLVSLAPHTECSCAVYYVYRVLRRVKEPSDREWLAHVPTCYRQKYLHSQTTTNIKRSDSITLNEMNDLDKLEEVCKFREMVDSCGRVESENVDDLVEQCEAPAIDHRQFDQVLVRNKSFKKKTERVIVAPVVTATSNQPSVNQETFVTESSESLDDLFDQKPEWNQVKGEEEDDDQNDDVLDLREDEFDEEEASIDSGSLEDTENDDDNDDGFDDDEDDEEDASYSSENVFKNTSVLIYFIIGLTTAILAFIIVFIIIILRLKFSKRARGGFILYEEDEENDDNVVDGKKEEKQRHYYDNNNEEDELNDTVNSKQNLIESMLTRKSSSPPNHHLLKCNVVMECDPNSVDPIVTSSLSANPYNSQLTTTTTALRVKENPFNSNNV